jgi:hypothetical protein
MLTATNRVQLSESPHPYSAESLTSQKSAPGV